tara:strand:- start:537 stop:728 length:192 start_codon:yes stop_codon:yes gene_type:complete
MKDLIKIAQCILCDTPVYHKIHNDTPEHSKSYVLGISTPQGYFHEHCLETYQKCISISKKGKK